MDGFEEIKILQQYLYMAEEHYVEIKNSIGVPLRIRMSDSLHYFCKNLNFPDVPESCWSEVMTLETTLDVITLLKEQPAVEFPDKFNNRWEEIKGITAINVGQNQMTRERFFSKSRG